MFMEKSKVLADAPMALNKPDQKWEATVEGDSIVARWKWRGTDIFDPTTNTFAFTVTLNEKGKWKEREKVNKKSDHAFGKTNSVNIGKTYQKSIEFSIGRNKQTEKVEINEISSMDSATIKRAIRDYLTACGWKKAGLFEKL